MPHEANIEHDHKCSCDIVPVSRTNARIMRRKDKYCVETQQKSVSDKLSYVEHFLVEYTAIKVRFLVQELVIYVCCAVPLT